MKKLYLLLLLIWFVGMAAEARKETGNVVIQQINDVYTLVAAPDGSTLDHVDYTTEITFRSRRVADRAVALLYYNDYISIEKVKGGVQSYGSYFSDDVFFSDSKACMVAVDLKKADATATVSARLKFNRPEFFTRIFLAEEYDIEHADITFVMPESLAGRYTIEPANMQRTGGCSVTEERKGGKVTYRYSITDVPAVRYERRAPSLNLTAPRLKVRGHFRDVDELYRYLYAYITDADPGAAAVAEKAAQLTAGAIDDNARLAAITDYVHNNIRYVAVEHGEFGQRPDLASEVLRKNYGDCKGSARLIRDMLRAVGIDGRLVWVGTDNIEARWTDEPSLSSGDHMIAAAVLGDSILFIDGTAKYCHLGQLPTGIQGRQAMIENGPERPLIADIPLLPPTDNSDIEQVDIRLTPQGVMEINATIRMTGAIGRSIMAAIDDTPPAKRQQQYDRILLTAMQGAKMARADYRIDGDTVMVSGAMTRDGAVTRAGDMSYIDLNPMAAIGLQRIDTEERTLDADLGSTRHVSLTMTVHLPDGAEPGELPADCVVESQWFDASVTNNYDPAGHTVSRTLTYTVTRPRVALDQLEQYNSLIAKLNRASKSKIPLIN